VKERKLKEAIRDHQHSPSPFSECVFSMLTVERTKEKKLDSQLSQPRVGDSMRLGEHMCEPELVKKAASALVVQARELQKFTPEQAMRQLEKIVKARQREAAAREQNWCCKRRERISCAQALRELDREVDPTWKTRLATWSNLLDSVCCRVRDPLSIQLRLWSHAVHTALWLSVVTVTYRVGFRVTVPYLGAWWWIILAMDFILLADVVIQFRTGYFRTASDSERTALPCGGAPCSVFATCASLV